MFVKASMYLGILFLIAPVSLRAQATDPSTFSLSPGDVTEAIVNSSTPARLKVMLTPAKSEELRAFTDRNLNKQVRIVVADKLRSEPFIRERMPGPAMELYVASTEDALAMVKALLTSNLKLDQLPTWTDSNGETHYSEKAPVRSPEHAPPANQSTEERSAAVLKQLLGSWQVIQATMNGKESADPSLLEGQWNFQGDQLVLRSPKGTVRFALTVDATADPKAFHLTAVEPANAGSGWMLFSRETNTLKIAFNDNLQGRPSGFKPSQPRAEPELVVVILAPKK
jgi:uncharacterized protein (TIGR03067 family)